MKVTINKPEDSIDLSMVTEDMYFVGVNPQGKANNILTTDGYFSGEYSFRNIPFDFTKGNRAEVSGTIKECIEHYFNSCKGQVHAFRTYQEAFKFIAENL